MTVRADFARLGFRDAGRAQRLLGPGGVVPAGGLLEACASAADPDLALLTLTRLAEVQPSRVELFERLAECGRLRQRLVSVLGASTALGDHLVAHPADWRLLDGDEPAAVPPPAELGRALLVAVGADPDQTDPVAARGGAGAEAELRTAYRRRLLQLAARDLGSALDVAAVAAELSDLAAATLEAALAVGRARLPAGAVPVRLAVIALGKCGGHELNYVSDVDVVFVAEPAAGAELANGAESAGAAESAKGAEPADTAAALHTATALASTLVRICGNVAWPVDAGLRPEGKDGPLVRTLDSHLAYYQRWAKTWEFQALLKARPVAGDVALGEEYLRRLTPLVWAAADREHFVTDVQAMRRRVEAAVPRAQAERELKLGPGGLRDVEFAVQLLQLVHGRADESLRSGSTLVALAALAAGGYVGRADAASLDQAYRWLRTVEHRLQLQRLRRTHRIPDGEVELRWLARALGYSNGRTTTAVQAFEADRARHTREVRRLHEKLFYRPLLLSVSRVAGEDLRLAPAAAQTRLAVLGFADPSGAMRHLQALSAGVSRASAIQRALLPAMLRSFADGADPDGGLLAYRRVSEALGRTPWYLGFLRDEGVVAERLALLLGSSRYVADLLARAPEALRMLAFDAELEPRPASTLHGAMSAAVQRSVDPEHAVAAIRGLRRAELLRIASADLLGQLDVGAVGVALSDVTGAVLEAALETALAAAAARRGGQLPMRMALIAMGRLGGAEVGYGSDADVLFVYEPTSPGAPDGAQGAAQEVAEELRRLLGAPAADPPLDIDAGLRPEGRQGPLVRSLGSYAAYYERWASVWEAQALLRARPVAGDATVGERFVALVDRYRYPAGGIGSADVTEIRRIKARVDSERLPRGADPATHLKLGPGGLGDVEWTVQLLQLRHGHREPLLQTTGTLAALAAAERLSLLAAADAHALSSAWRLASRVRNAVLLVRGRPADSIPRRGRELVGVARAVGYPPGADPGGLVEDYLRTARRARAVVDRVFFA